MKLYKKTATGAIQLWETWLDGATIFTDYGQIGGKIQGTFDTIEEGKNIGKANETTREQQAELEMKSAIEHKLKCGYVRSIEQAESGEVDKIIKGGYVPMTAKVYQEYEQEVKFPVAVQPKLDGIRACRQGVRLWTRTRKVISTVPHIETVLNRMTSDQFDGELYNHAYRDDFEKIVSAVRNEKTFDPELQSKIQYHIYDINGDGDVLHRLSCLQFYEKYLLALGVSSVKIVETVIVNDRRELDEYYRRCMDRGYEGIMVRRLDSLYEQKRSKHLLKYKEFNDDEFRVVDVKEGRGKLKGHVGSFVCMMDNGETFEAKLKGKTENLKRYFQKPELWRGNSLTVQFQGYSINGKPRFPVGLRFRDGDL